MASNAASSVQFHVNGTEIARERARKTDRTQSADPKAQPHAAVHPEDWSGREDLNLRPPGPEVRI